MHEEGQTILMKMKSFKNSTIRKITKPYALSNHPVRLEQHLLFHLKSEQKFYGFHYIWALLNYLLHQDLYSEVD